jgi:hypothetical protein
MDREELGLVGRLAADRPLIVTLVLAFGVTAIAALSSSDQATGSAARRLIFSFITVCGTMTAAPLLLASFAPARLSRRALYSAGLALLAIGAFVMQPNAAWLDVSASPGAAGAAAGASVALVLAAPFLGAIARSGYVAAIAALLGAAGGAGLVGLQGAPALIGPVASVALTLGAIAGLAVIADFGALFARGSDRRDAAGAAAQYGTGPALYMAIAAGAAFAIYYSAEPALRLAVSGFVGAGVMIAAFTSIFSAAGALALRHAGEGVAVEENRRRRAFRDFWRPIRGLLPPSAANATVAIAAIAVIAAAFDMRSPFQMSSSAFIIAAAGAAGLIFFSLRAGVFVFFSLLVGAVCVKWLWLAFDAPQPGPEADAAAMALCAALLGQLAVAWRDARSPRLNARETTEAAMSEGARLYLAGAMFGMLAYFAASVAGVWPQGGLAAAQAGATSIIALLLAPALMTALSDAVRRELG